jgi:hypothetical protein
VEKPLCSIQLNDKTKIYSQMCGPWFSSVHTPSSILIAGDNDHWLMKHGKLTEEYGGMEAQLYVN